MKEIDIKILNPLIKDKISLPEYGTEGSGGMDLRACLDNKIELAPSETIMIPMGFAMHLADKSLAALVIPRSGLGSKHGIVLGNLVGLIDSDYQGQLFVSCWNRSDQDYKVEPYDRIAQLIFITINQPKLKIVDSFKKSTRGSDGFGSSGKK